MADTLPNSNERQLWAQVIIQARADIRAGGDLAGKVRRWIGSRDFVTVCERAGLEPDPVATYLQKGGRHGAQYRDARKAA